MHPIFFILFSPPPFLSFSFTSLQALSKQHHYLPTGRTTISLHLFSNRSLRCRRFFRSPRLSLSFSSFFPTHRNHFPQSPRCCLLLVAIEASRKKEASVLRNPLRVFVCLSSQLCHAFLLWDPSVTRPSGGISLLTVRIFPPRQAGKAVCFIFETFSASLTTMPPVSSHIPELFSLCLLSVVLSSHANPCIIDTGSSLAKRQ